MEYADAGCVVVPVGFWMRRKRVQAVEFVPTGTEVERKLMQAVEFVLIILVVQQVDGNFIAPRIIGSATGLPGLGVLLAIIVGGNLFGIPGMVIGVPTLAVIVTLLREAVGAGLAARGIDEDGNPLSDIKN